MKELVEKEQTVTVVPKNFQDSNKGTVVHVEPDGFKMKLKYEPRGILLKNFYEFYSQTSNGVLYFESFVMNMDGRTIKIANPIKHRFLQRRKFTRIKFIQDIELKTGEESFKVTSLDLSAGGMKLKSDTGLNIEPEYKLTVVLSDDQEISCKFQAIRIEKNDDGYYILSGRFKALSNIDKMTLIQYCMQKDIENRNKKQ